MNLVSVLSQYTFVEEEAEDSYLMYGADGEVEPQNGETTGDSPPTSRPPTPEYSSGRKKKRKETPEMSEKRITVSANDSI